jgi:O-antigen/teichoic acid export membrane protein
MSAAAVPRARHALVESVLIGLLGQAAVVVSGVVVARTLGVESRGDLALLSVLPLILTQFGGLGLPLATTFEIVRQPSIARTLLRQLARFIWLQTFVLTLLHAAILVLLLADRPHQVRVAAAYTLVTVPAFNAMQHGLAVMQGQHRYREFNVLRLAPMFLYAALAVALFVLDRGTLPVLAACYAACWLVIGMVTLVRALAGSAPEQPGATPPPTAQLVRFGARSVLGSASPSDGFGIDQAVVGLLVSTRALGLYVVASAFTNLTRFVTQSIGLVAYPLVAAQRDAKDADRAMWRFTAIGVLAVLAIVVVLELAVGRLISFFFGESFAGSAGVARVLLVAALFVGARRVLSDAARGANRQLIGTIAEVASWTVFVPALLVLTPLLDLYGTAMALVAASAVSLAVLVRGVRRAPRAAPQPAGHGGTPSPDVTPEVPDVV